MKKILALATVAVVGASLVSCDDFLDKNRYQLTTITNTPEYWSNAANVQLQVDRYQDEINSGYGTGGGQGTFFYDCLNDDQVGSSFADWAYLTVPSTNGNWTYTKVRGANYIIDGVNSSSLSGSERLNFIALARLIRADAYFKLVRTFGDAVWESHVVDPGDPAALYAPRTNRDEVMDSVLADLDYAIKYITTEKSKTGWSKDLARAIKSEVCLYEGTFCKYRTEAENGYKPDLERANKYLDQCIAVSSELLDRYGFTDDYHSIYNSVWGGGNSTVVEGAKISDFSTNPEIIFGRRYDVTNGRHSLISYTCSSTTTRGMSLDAFLSFLFLDGKPYSQQSAANQSLEGEVVDYDGNNAGKSVSIAKQLQLRDKRLSIITDPNIYYKGMEWSRAGATGMNSSSGFGVAKYDNVLLPVEARNMSAQNYTSAPIFWTSYIACNFAEAKAERGNLSDADLNRSLNVLYKRAGLPEQTVAGLNAIADNANNMGVSSLIWEVRRCRRCELMFDRGDRYHSLVRWHQLDKLDSKKYPNILRGAYVANSPVQTPDQQDGYFRPYRSTNREFKPKYYYQPIPSGQINLYPSDMRATFQNPLWRN